MMQEFGTHLDYQYICWRSMKMEGETFGCWVRFLNLFYNECRTQGRKQIKELYM